METTMNRHGSTSFLASFQLNHIILLAAAGLILRAFFLYEPPLVPLQVGNPIPQFRLELFEGKTLTSDQVMGAPHVFFFFANWCPCANHSAPLLKRAFEEYSGKGIQFVGVGFQDKQEDLRAFAERHKLPFPVGSNDQDITAKAFGIGTPPTTIFVDSHGKISSIFTGKIKKYENLKEYLEKM